MKKNIYRIHRTLSLIIALPVLLWAVSGFMHPLMTNIRPQVATQALVPETIDSSYIHVPLQAALQKHHIATFSNFRLIHIDTNWFYQVQPTVHAIPVYISTANGNILPSGDWLYAQYLARQFLEGQETIQHTAAPAPIIPVVHNDEDVHDCCGAATTCVLNNARGSKVANVSLQNTFTDEYKEINRLLPVYKVSFERVDGIRIYVETTQDRFAFAMDNKRAVFDKIFQVLHTWSWLDGLGKGKLVIIILIALLALFTTILGIYIFFTTKSKKVKGNELVRARRNHRYTAIVAATFTLLWTFSGAYHAFSKFTEDTRDKFYIENTFTPADADLNVSRLLQAAQKPVTNIGIVQMSGERYWQVLHPATGNARQDLMKNTSTTMPATSYVNTKDYSLLQDGDVKYAGYMAAQFSGNAINTISTTTPITRFGDEYNFTDKRLPVWRVSYSTHHNERYYVETTSGKLASRVDDTDLPEGYSFSVFHKHHFMDWGGKIVRDLSTMFWALVQVLMVLIGLLLYARYVKRKKAIP